MITRKQLLLVAGAAVLAAGVASPIAGAWDRSAPAATAIKRSMPDGKTDVIKAMGNSKWGHIPRA